MAGRDYILCRDCGEKLIYDGDDSIRSRLEETYGDPSACDWTVELVCPPCLKKIEDQRAAPVGWICSPDGHFKRNPLYRIESPPQSIAWQVPVYTAPQQAELVQAAVLAERAACAQLCADYTEWARNWGQDSNHTAAEAAANECADAIRARGRQAEPVQAAVAMDVKTLAAKAGLPLAWISEKGVIQWSQLERLVALAQQAEPSVVISPPAELKYVISPTRMGWDKAMKWAVDQGLRLATVEEMGEMSLPHEFYWSGTECSQSYAWYFHTLDGGQYFDDKGFALFAVAVAHKSATEPADGQFMSQADDNGNPSY